jgi:hypothetical protein
MKSIVVRKIYLMLILFIGALGAKAQQEVLLTKFESIKVTDAIQVEIILSKENKLVVSENVKENRLPKTMNGILLLNAENCGMGRVELYTDGFSKLATHDVSTVSSQDTLKLNTLEVVANDASNIHLLLSIENIQLTLNDVSKMTISGNATKASITTKDAANFDGEQFSIEDATIYSSDVSNTKALIKGSIYANAKDASKISYDGEATVKAFQLDDVATINNNKTGEKFDKTEMTEPNDTTKLSLGKKNVMIYKKKLGKDKRKHRDENSMKSVWGGFELGIEGFTQPDFNFSMDKNYKFLENNIGKSWFFALNSPDMDAHIIKNKLAVTTGFGARWNNIRFDGNSLLAPNIDSLGMFVTPGINYTTNRLFTFDLTAPLLIKYNAARNGDSEKGIHFAAGAIIHYIVSQHLVTETSSNGYTERRIVYDDFNINPFRADATVRVGYNNIKLFANYSLTPYFNSSKGPDIRMFSAGLTLIGW